MAQSDISTSPLPLDRQSDCHTQAGYSESLRSVLVQLLQSSGAELKSGQAEVLVDALLTHTATPRPSEQSEQQIEDGADDVDDEAEASSVTLIPGNEMDDDKDPETCDDLPLGVPESPVQGSSDADSVTASRARSTQEPIHNVSSNLASAGITRQECEVYGDACGDEAELTTSLTARLGADLADHLYSERWIHRHPSVATVMDTHPELIDIVSDLLRERQSLQHSLAYTQQEMKRRQTQHQEHVQYLEEISKDQVEVVRYELASQQAAVLQNLTTELNPDLAIDHMAKQLQDKEERLDYLLGHQQELQEELEVKTELHTDQLRHYEQAQQALLGEVNALRSQLKEVKVRSLNRRRRFGGDSGSRPSSMLMEQLTALAGEKAEEAERLRSELLSLQRQQQDDADVQQHSQVAGKQVRKRSGVRLEDTSRGSALYSYGLDINEMEMSQEWSYGGGQSSVDSGGAYPWLSVGSDGGQSGSGSPRSARSHSLPRSALLGTNVKSPLSKSSSAPPNGKPLLAGKPPNSQAKSNLVPLDTAGDQECGSDLVEDEALFSVSPCDSPPAVAATVSNSAKKDHPSHKIQQARHAPPEITATSASHTSPTIGLGVKARQGLVSLLNVPGPDAGQIKVYRSRSCPRLEQIPEQESADSNDAPAAPSNSPTEVSRTNGEAALMKQSALEWDSDDDDIAARTARSHSFAGRGESKGAKLAESTTASRIDWLTEGQLSSSISPYKRIDWKSAQDVHLFNIAILGPSGVGKTTFITSLRGGGGTPGHEGNRATTPTKVTVGLDCVVCSTSMHGQDVSLKFWDTAGAERFQSLASGYLRRCDAVILMFDVTQPSSLQGARLWYEKAKDLCRDDIIVLLLGNKIDCTQDQYQPAVVGMSEAITFAHSLNSAMYLEVSAKENYGVREARSIITVSLLGKQTEHNRVQSRTKPVVLGDKEPEEKTSSCCWS